MRAVRFTKAEAAWLSARLTPALEAPTKDRKVLVSILAKLSAAKEPSVPGVAAGPFEDALIDAARGKVVKVVGGDSVYARISRQATAAGATIEDARLLGGWLARASWLREPLTIFTVLAKWPDWLAKARAVAPPSGAQEGLNGHVGQGPAPKRAATSAGRRPAGLG